MAKNIYENPNGRRRRAARGSTNFRDYVKQSKVDMEKLAPGLKYNTVSEAANVTGRNVTAPWSDGANFRTGVGEGRTVQNYGYNKKEIQEFIQETARVAQQDYGLENINVNTVYGTVDGTDEFVEGMFSWGEGKNNHHMDIYVDTIWKNTALGPDGELLEDGVERFKEQIKYTIGHELRHQWQHTTEDGKVIEELDDEYHQTKINDYDNDYDKYYHEPVEVDARYHGEKFKKSYELKAKKYKERLNQSSIPDFQEKLEEIELRPKNRIIGQELEPIETPIKGFKKTPKKLTKNSGSSLRPTITMSGNNVEIDSIYNHAVPKKLDKQNDIPNSEPEIETPKVETSQTPEPKIEKPKVVQADTDTSAGVVNKNPRPKAKTTPTVRDGKKINKVPVGKKSRVVSGTPKRIPLRKKDIAKAVVSNVVSNTAQEAVKEVAKNTAQEAAEEVAKNAKKVVGNMNDPTTWTDDFIEQTAEGDPYYFDELQRRRQEAINNKGKGQSQVDPNDPTTWTDDYMDEVSEGDPAYYEELRKQRQNAIDGKTKAPEIKSNNTADDVLDNVADSADDVSALSKLKKSDMLMSGLNIIGAVGDYKDARRKGHGVVSSAVRAGAKFAIDEALGLWALPVALISNAPGAIIKGADALYKENRKMNSAANFQAFGGAQFMDTQQLATMRQSGMEMAKMANYNLQQTLMGNEATYLHR